MVGSEELRETSGAGRDAASRVEKEGPGFCYGRFVAMRMATSRLFWMALGAGIFGCNGSRSGGAYDLTLRVTGDLGRPLAGAKVFFEGAAVGKSNDRGVVRLAVRGREGEAITLTVACPDGFRPPSRPIEVALRKLAEPGASPEFSASCQPLTRSVVVAVRADNGADLPVRYLGQEVARTDASGAAHVLLTLASEEEFELTLDTTGKTGEILRPQNPSARFTVKSVDEILTFNVPFTVERPAPKARGKRDLPIRI